MITKVKPELQEYEDISFKEEPLWFSEDEHTPLQSQPESVKEEIPFSESHFNFGTFTVEDKSSSFIECDQNLTPVNDFVVSKVENAKCPSDLAEKCTNQSIQLINFKHNKGKENKQNTKTVSFDDIRNSEYPLVKLCKLDIKNLSAMFLTEPTACQKNASENVKRHDKNYSNPLKCPQCNYRSEYQGNLKRHVTGHFEKKFKCSKCDYRTHRSDHFKNHQSCHLPKVLKCLVCEFKTNNKTLLGKHQEIHGFKICYNENCKKEIHFHKLNQSGKNIFKCIKCDYNCSHKSKIERHFLRHLKVKLFKCSRCHYTSNYKAHLKRHALMHERKDTKKN